MLSNIYPTNNLMATNKDINYYNNDNNCNMMII